MKIAFRVDASPVMGSGHLRRCLALAEALRQIEAEVTFVTRDLGFDFAALIGRADNQIVALSTPDEAGGIGADISEGPPYRGWAGVSWQVDAAQTIAALKADPPDWIVVDHYAFDAHWHSAVRRELNCKIAVIDDLADRALDADILIDHNVSSDHGAKYAGRISAGQRLLGGPRFALIAPVFAQAERYKPAGLIRSIGVFMGGIDGINASTTVLDAIDFGGFVGPVEVVATSGYPHLAALTASVAARTNTTLTLDLPDLAAFFGRHDLQIGAGGGASWERCCIGVPTLLLVVADNQRAVVPQLVELGVVATTEPLGALDVGSIAAAVKHLIAAPDICAEMAAGARKLVDGFGPYRVALSIGVDGMSVRPASLQDSAIAHRWRNDPATRSVSRDKRAIPLEAHNRWFEQALADPARQLMIAEIGSTPVGVIRFDLIGSSAAEVSLYLDPGLHGLGLGRAMLLAGERACAEQHACADQMDIFAEVLDGNIGSARLFASAGYAAIGPGQWKKSVTAPSQKGT